MEDLNTIILNPGQLFSLDKTLSCGQVQRWFKEGDWWYGIIRDTVIKIRQEGDTLSFTGCDAEFVIDFFSLDFDLNRFYEKMNRDEYTSAAVDANRGLRLVHQDPWECLIFQMTVNRIRTKSESNRITRISTKIGKEIEFEGHIFHTIPRPEEIIEAGLPALKSCNIGYFADNIMAAAKKTASSPGWERRIMNMTYDEAVSALTSFKGIKHRVAEWILLLAFRRYEAFPVDAHIRKIFCEYYIDGRVFGSGDDTLDDQIRKTAARFFGEYSGYALEYLFFANLENEKSAE